MPARIATTGDYFDKQKSLGPGALSSVAMHVLVAATIFGFAYVRGSFHGETWGEATPGSAIQATLISKAALPLPQDHPPTENVLATDKPSPAPAPAAPAPTKTAPVEDKAIPIATKQVEKTKPAPQKQAPAPKQAAPPKPSVTPTQRPQPTPKQDDRAQYGEGSPSNVAKSTPGAQSSSASAAVVGGDFGTKYPYYYSQITNVVKQNWYTAEIASGTPYGRQVVITFLIDRSGHPTNIQIAQSSGSPSLDMSGKRAVMRVDSFGPLPSTYRDNTVSVAYTFTYEKPNQ